MVKMLPRKPVAASGNGTSVVAAPAKTIPEVAALPSTLTVQRTYRSNNEVTGEESETTELEVNRFQTEVARVSMTAGYKKNMGNYESAEIRYSVTLPCYVEEIDEAFARANDIVNEQLTAGLESLGEPEAAEAEVEAEEGVEEADGTEGEAEAEAEDGISEEEVLSYDRDQLTELVTGNELPVDPDEFADNPKGLAKFRTAVWEALEAFMAEAGEGEEVAEEAEEAEAEAEADAEEPFTPYTAEELKDFDLAQLEQLRADWEMAEIKVPKAAKDKGKAAYIKAILEHQKAFTAE